MFFNYNHKQIIKGGTSVNYICTKEDKASCSSFMLRWSFDLIFDQCDVWCHVKMTMTWRRLRKWKSKIRGRRKMGEKKTLKNHGMQWSWFPIDSTIFLPYKEDREILVQWWGKTTRESQIWIKSRLLKILIVNFKTENVWVFSTRMALLKEWHISRWIMKLQKCFWAQWIGWRMHSLIWYIYYLVTFRKWYNFGPETFFYFILYCSFSSSFPSSN
jgi:hypothetical protein